MKARVTQLETGDFPTVRAYVAVTDDQDALIKTLKEGDFTVTENGTPVEGLHFASSSANLPLAIMFCVDVSGSMAPSIEQEKEAIRSFVAQLKPEDRVGLVTFSDAAVTQVSLTTNRQEINQAVDLLVRSTRPRCGRRICRAAGAAQRRTALRVKRSSCLAMVGVTAVSEPRHGDDDV